MVNMLEFDISSPTASHLAKLAEEALRQDSMGFTPKRMDKYPVEIMPEVEGNRGAMLELENSGKRRVTFDYILFANGESYCMMWEYLPDNPPMSIEEFLKSLP